MSVNTGEQAPRSTMFSVWHRLPDGRRVLAGLILVMSDGSRTLRAFPAHAGKGEHPEPFLTLHEAEEFLRARADRLFAEGRWPAE